jgi:hypothetical protein
LQQIAQANPGSIAASDLAAKNSEFQISMERLDQGERRVRYLQLLVQLAQVELEKALEANKQAPGSVPASEIRRLEIMVQLAEAKFREMAE